MNKRTRFSTSRTAVRPDQLKIRRKSGFFPAWLALVVFACLAVSVYSQNRFDKHPIAAIQIKIEGANGSNSLIEQYRETAASQVGTTYSAPRIRDAIEELYKTGRIDTISVAASQDPAGDVTLVFNIKPKLQASRVTVELGPSEGDKVTEQELLFELNVLSPGTPITEQALRSNADNVLDYLREKGFYRSKVEYTRRPIPNSSEVGITFLVTPNAQATISTFKINIEGYSKPILPTSLKLHPGEGFTREKMLADLARVRDLLRKDDFLAPEIEEPQPRYDDETNTISLELVGKAGPKVTVDIVTGSGKPSSATQTTLLPIKRDGTLDFSAIVEGERRLENYYQEQGYFFNNFSVGCSVTPPLTDTEDKPITNDTEFLCSLLGGEELLGREVKVVYTGELDRKLRLTEIRLRGTDKITIEDIRAVLRSKEANLLGVIPVFGLGRGYTSAAILEEDRNTIKSIMAELGYQRTDVQINRGVSTNGEDLIITFVVDEGIPTVVENVEVVGNKAIPTDQLTAELPVLVGRNYSRARTRNAARKLTELYSRQGYYYARVITEVPDEGPVTAEKHSVKIRFKIDNEGKQVVINRILVNGNVRTKTNAIEKALALEKGELLRFSDVYLSEQNLYSSDAFSRVQIKPEPAGDTSDGKQLNDIVVDVDEQPPRLMSYGGGFSTDLGLSGFFDIRHVNLFGKLWQGGARIRGSQRQQLVQFDLVNPRFLRDGDRRFAPLTFSVLYQRDTTVTRFFRSAFDRGTFGIVQRVDEDGNPIDEFGANVGSPTLNRFAVSGETSRTISRKNRTILFLRYRYEDVRLYNIESLLIRDLLRPDQKTRISGFTTTFVRDTRKNCSTKYSLLDLISKGDQTDPCRYNASDPTRGDYLTADYTVSVPALGANIGFQKFQASYNYYYTFGTLGKQTTLAARGILGVGRVFSGGDRFLSTDYPALNGLLPISERFFAGGGNNLRGFNYEEAGPRVVVVPQGIFKNSKGEDVHLDPFTIPFGGNALAVVNLEARIPLTSTIRAVPFYDGGNVFRKSQDIFRNPTIPVNDFASFNQQARWTHTVGLGFRIRTPVGGELGVDYGHLLSPPKFLIPQPIGPPATYRLPQSHIHFRFSQAF
jgi:outer membrane protein insertion porin family